MNTTIYHEMLLKHMGNGGWITSGGHTYSEREYMAYGTYPGSVRGGPYHTLHGNIWDWKVTNIKEIIIRKGYCPSLWYRCPTDGSVSQCDLYYLWMYILKKAKSYNDFIDPNKNRVICREYLIGD